MTEPVPALVMYRVGGRQYPMTHVPNCRVCHSPYRVRVEQALADGASYKAISEAMPEEHRITVHCIMRHYKNHHMPLEIEQVRAIVEDRARQRGALIEEGLQPLVDHVSLAQTVVHKTFESIARGEIRPTIRDGLRAGMLLHRVDVDSMQEEGDEDLAQAFMAYMEAAQAVMSIDQWQEFGKRLESSPVLRSLKAKHEAEKLYEPVELEAG